MQTRSLRMLAKQPHVPESQDLNPAGLDLRPSQGFSAVGMQGQRAQDVETSAAEEAPPVLWK